MLYKRDLDPSSRYSRALRTIARQLLADRCMFFLGAGASLSAAPSLPSANSLSRKMAEDCLLEWHEYIPLSTIAFYYESDFTRVELNRLLIHSFLRPDIPPSPAIRKLMEVLDVLEKLKQTTYTITTNYDEQFERAYREYFRREAEVLIYKGAFGPQDKLASLNCTPSGPLSEPAKRWRPRSKKARDPYETPQSQYSGDSVLYKMHGTISQAMGKGLVITEEDYINFLANSLGERDEEKLLLQYITSELAYRTVVFVGYSLSDWNFRAIYKATVEKSGYESRSYAIQYVDPSRPPTEWDQRKADSLERFWEDKQVDIILADSSVFMGDLFDRLVVEQATLARAGAGHAY